MRPLAPYHRADGGHTYHKKKKTPTSCAPSRLVARPCRAVPSRSVLSRKKNEERQAAMAIMLVKHAHIIYIRGIAPFFPHHPIALSRILHTFGSNFAA